MVSFAKVDVKEIRTHLNRSNFSEAEIEKLADLILAGDGLSRPLILRRLGVEEYNLVAGELEYFAAVRAREKEPQKAEMVNAILVSGEEETTIEEQIKLLNTSAQVTPVSVMPSPATVNSEWITSFETRLSNFREEFFQSTRQYDARLNALEKNISEDVHLSLLEAINTLDEQKLLIELSRCGMVSKKGEAVVAARRERKENGFASYQDLEKSVKGLGASGILRLIDTWDRLNQRRK
jgi:hypothetical protein